MTFTDLMRAIGSIEEKLDGEEKKVMSVVRDRVLFAEAIMIERDFVPLSPGQLSKLMDQTDIDIVLGPRS